MKESNSQCCSPNRFGNVTSKFSTQHLQNDEREEDLGNFVTIPAGEFLMGSDETFYPTDGEGPSRSVWLDEFKISKYSVSNLEFASFVHATGYKTEAEMFGWSYVFKGFVDETSMENQAIGVATTAPWWLAIEGANWFYPYGNSKTVVETLNHPVVHISFNDALAFCNWSGLRLPTEAQWEKASRGGLVGKRFPRGDQLLNSEGHQMNIWQGEFPSTNSIEDGFFGTSPVDSFPPNGFGLYNTVGNVWEWTKDVWSARWHIPDDEATRKNPLGPQRVSGNRVLKGGSFLCHESYCYRYRNSARTYNSPSTSTSHIGFRCVNPN